MDAGGLPFQLKLSGDKSQILQESDSHGDSKLAMKLTTTEGTSVLEASLLFPNGRGNRHTQ